MLVSPVAGRAVDAFGEFRVALAGLLLQVLGYAWIAAAAASGASYPSTVVPLVLSGIGISMSGPAVQKAVLASPHRSDAGTAAGVFNVFR